MDISREYWSWRHKNTWWLCNARAPTWVDGDDFSNSFWITSWVCASFGVSVHLFWPSSDEVKMWSTVEIQLTLIVRPLDELCVVFFLQYRIWVNLNHRHQLCGKFEKRSKCRDDVLQFIAFALSPRAMLKFSSSYKSLTFYGRSAADFTKRLKTGGRKNARLWNSMIWESFF